MMQIGCDIVEVARIGAALKEHGERFVKRVLTDHEFQIYSQHASPVHFLAKRYAAKEAIGKAFGTGIGADFAFHDVTIHKSSKGRPVVKPNDRAYNKLKELGYTDILLSISDEKHYAMAMVMLVE